MEAHKAYKTFINRSLQDKVIRLAEYTRSINIYCLNESLKFIISILKCISFSNSSFIFSKVKNQISEE